MTQQPSAADTSASRRGARAGRGLPGRAGASARRSIRDLLALCVLSGLLGCSNCGEQRAAVKPHKQVAPAATEGPERKPVEIPPGVPLSGETFRPFAPDEVAGFVATGPGEPMSSGLANGGTLTTFSRSYKRGEQTLRVEYSDSLHAPLLPRVIKQQQGRERKTEQSTFQGTAVAGNPAVLQYQARERTAYANVLIADRILLNVRVIPAADVQVSVEVATALPLAGVAKVVPAAKVDGGTTGPAAAAQDGGKPSGALQAPAGKPPAANAQPARPAKAATKSPD